MADHIHTLCNRRVQELKRDLEVARNALHSISLGTFSTRNAKSVATQTLARLSGKEEKKPTQSELQHFAQIAQSRQEEKRK